MTSSLQHILSLQASSDKIANATEVQPSSTNQATNSKKLLEASRQFEAIFLRQMLSSLERTTSIQGAKAGGSQLYGSMLVDAVADSVSRAGGIGLGSMLVNSLAPRIAKTPQRLDSAGLSSQKSHNRTVEPDRLTVSVQGNAQPAVPPATGREP
jgi:flagellar protein FlgJ